MLIEEYGDQMERLPDSEIDPPGSEDLSTQEYSAIMAKGCGSEDDCDIERSFPEERGNGLNTLPEHEMEQIRKIEFEV
jgi:hypothetical protein